jgi:hypothetical protein
MRVRAVASHSGRCGLEGSRSSADSPNTNRVANKLGIVLAFAMLGATTGCGGSGNDDAKVGNGFEVDAVTCEDLTSGNQKLVDRFGGTLAGELANELSNEPGYVSDDFVLDGVEADINTFCSRAINEDYAPAEDIRQDIRGAIASIGG